MSRRNRVWLEDNIIYKQILPQPGESGAKCRRAAFEADMLAHLRNRGVSVPKIISCENNLLAMEYIQSKTLTDYIESCENGADQTLTETIIEQLVCWFESFYDALPQGSVRGDVNCRNFLVTPDGNIVGVDFETINTGIRETDLGKLIAFILTYRPQNTAYKKYLTDLLCQKFISRFCLDPVLISNAKAQELRDMTVRRKRKLLTEQEDK